MKISQNFDSGSIEVVDVNNPEDIQLKLKADNNADVKQWFHFKLTTKVGQFHKMSILNASKSSFSSAWQGYQVMASYDDNHWFRINTRYEGGLLTFEHTPEQSLISYAYFAPYSHQRHEALIKRSKSNVNCHHSVIGLTNDKNPIDLLTIGDENSHKNKVWLIARQHPGETMAQWFIDGLLQRLTEPSTGSSIFQHKDIETLLAENVFYIVPNMNLDGSIRGNHRTNAKGLNLNRQWQNPSKIDCPEVYYVKRMMQEKGVDLFLDIHGDEEIPHSFIMQGGTSCKFAKQINKFKDNFILASEHFQKDVDYNTYHKAGTSCCGNSTCGGKNLSKASDYVADKFDCLSMVLEMPFIDNVKLPSKEFDGSVKTSMELGYAIIDPIFEHLTSIVNLKVK